VRLKKKRNKCRFLYAQFVLILLFISSRSLGAQTVTTGTVKQRQDYASAELLQRVSPIYPPLARQARIQGDVVLDVIIGQDGAVQSATLVSGNPLLVQSAIDAVKQWKYKPHLIDSKPGSVSGQVIINFSLQGADAPSAQSQTERGDSNKSAAGQSNSLTQGSQSTTFKEPQLGDPKYQIRQLYLHRNDSPEAAKAYNSAWRTVVAQQKALEKVQHDSLGKVCPVAQQVYLFVGSPQSRVLSCLPEGSEIIPTSRSGGCLAGYVPGASPSGNADFCVGVPPRKQDSTPETKREYIAEHLQRSGDQLEPGKKWKYMATGVGNRILKIAMPSVSENDINGLFRGGMAAAEELWKNGFRLTLVTDGQKYWAAPLSQDGYHEAYGPFDKEPKLETLAAVKKKQDLKVQEAARIEKERHYSAALSIRGLTVGTQLSSATEIFREEGFLRVPSQFVSSFCVGGIQQGTISCSWVHPTSPMSQSALLKGAQVQWDEGIDADFSIRDRGLVSLVYVFPCGRYENILQRFRRQFGSSYSTDNSYSTENVISWRTHPSYQGITTYVELSSGDINSKCKALLSGMAQ